jgi:hypothetical protein
MKRKINIQPTVLSFVTKRPRLLTHSITKLISGGQTGVDQIALNTAYALGIKTGGWAATNFHTCKGRAPFLQSKFDLQEIPGKMSLSEAYVARSKRNVDDSDGTVCFSLIKSLGTGLTIGYCLTKRWRTLNDHCIETKYKPCLVIEDLSAPDNSERIKRFLIENNIKILNVAGHRDEVVKGMAESIKTILTNALKGMSK